MYFNFWSKMLEYLRQKAGNLCMVHNTQIKRLKIVKLAKCHANTCVRSTTGKRAQKIWKKKGE